MSNKTVHLAELTKQRRPSGQPVVHHAILELTPLPCLSTTVTFDRGAGHTQGCSPLEGSLVFLLRAPFAGMAVVTALRDLLSSVTAVEHREVLLWLFTVAYLASPH